MLNVKVKKLNPDARVPYYDHPGDAGMALHSLEDAVLKPGIVHLFDLGFAMELPDGYVALFMDRSSMGAKGIKTMGGVVDAGYRGAYKLLLVNVGTEEYAVKRGDKIAQMLIMPIETAQVQEVSELSETSRGEGGFGSTGR
jgi:dUTP pyrophosphatase